MILKHFNETYASKLRDPVYLSAFLESGLAEGPETFYVGIRKAVQSREDGFTWLSKQTGMGRESLYKALSADGNPSFRTIYRILRELGVSEVVISSASRAEHVDRVEAA